MFGKKTKEISSDWIQEQSPVQAVCQIAMGTIITGNVKVQEANMRLDGQIIGEVFCAGRLILSQNALIQGNIDCLELVCEGKIEGNILARNGCALLRTAQIYGDIETKFLQVENGAILNGKISSLSRQ
jgi:cytoskeletal protein CcmA (bactofilin family)